MKKAKIEDILAQKEAELVTLSQRSVNAVQAVRSAIDNLTAINNGIETTVTEIDTYQQRLADTRSGLNARHQKNQQIVQNFKSLLCEE